jgi:hypothetical protein
VGVRGRDGRRQTLRGGTLGLAWVHLVLGVLLVLLLAAVSFVRWRRPGRIELDAFRGTHGDGLFPRAIVSDRMVRAVNAWLQPRPAGRVCHGEGG